jgi:hypothetical protein
MATTDFTNGVTLTDAGWFDDVDTTAYSVLTGVAGTNTITATGAATYSYAATRTPIWFIPANTNTGATTINVTPDGGAALGAKNVFWNGAACVGGELRQNVPAAVIYDGTQYHIIANGFNAPFSDAHAIVEGSADATKKVRMEVDGITTSTTRVLTVQDRDMTIGSVAGTEQATTSGTSITFSSIPSWVRRIVVQFVGVSTNGTSNILLQLGDSDGVENTGYTSAASEIGNAVATSVSTAGFIVAQGITATSTFHGNVTLTLEDASDNTWTSGGILYDTDGGSNQLSSGSKALSGTLDRVVITMANGTDAFDLGAINILYQG